MKIINFSVVEILPSLLDKSKTQTIRPAWERDRVQPDIVGDVFRPPRFKVKEKVKLYWNQRSKNRMWCVACKKPIGQPDAEVWGKCPHCNSEDKYWNKVLGNAEITEVFKIVMSINQVGHGDILIDREKYLNRKEGKELAKRDGFSSAEQLFSTLDKMYSLNSPKEFYVYGWKWL